MLRSARNLFALASLAALGAAGCAHCDTCDDMPLPCTGPGCGAPVYPYGGVPVAQPETVPSSGPFSPTPPAAGSEPSDPGLDPPTIAPATPPGPAAPAAPPVVPASPPAGPDAPARPGL